MLLYVSIWYEVKEWLVTSTSPICYADFARFQNQFGLEHRDTYIQLEKENCVLSLNQHQ
jgi:hypothetical protein